MKHIAIILVILAAAFSAAAQSVTVEATVNKPRASPIVLTHRPIREKIVSAEQPVEKIVSTEQPVLPPEFYYSWAKPPVPPDPNRHVEARIEAARLKFIADVDAKMYKSQSIEEAWVQNPPASVPVFGPNGKLVDEQPKKLSRWLRFNIALSSFLADGLSGASYRPYSYRYYGYRPIHVRSYTRRDGTYVRSHSRRSPH